VAEASNRRHSRPRKERSGDDYVKVITLVKRALFDPDPDDGEEFISLDEKATVFWFRSRTTAKHTLDPADRDNIQNALNGMERLVARGMSSDPDKLEIQKKIHGCVMEAAMALREEWM
jgi:hypothetical protein